MSKIRVSDLAKELGAANKDVLEAARQKGLVPSRATVSSGMEQRDADILRRLWRDRDLDAPPPARGKEAPKGKAAAKDKTAAKAKTPAKAKASKAARKEAAPPPAPKEEGKSLVELAAAKAKKQEIILLRKSAPAPPPGEAKLSAAPAAAPAPEESMAAPAEAPVKKAERQAPSPVKPRPSAPEEETAAAASAPQADSEKPQKPLVSVEEFAKPLSAPPPLPRLDYAPPRVEAPVPPKAPPPPRRPQPPGQHRPGQRPPGRPGGPAQPGVRKARPERVVPAEPQPASAPRYQGEPRLLYVPEGVTVKELAERMDVKTKDLLAELLRRGTFAHINQTLDQKTVESVCEIFGFLAEVLPFEEIVAREQGEAAVKESGGNEGPEAPRAPIVTVMGHVDHGKTKLLDAIRKTSVALSEAGGITQHIGAYHVKTHNPKDGSERSVVFLDTPGHEAFTRMRARGASVTDIVVLVVAADDGVKPQTREAYSHARAAGVPIVVAINKVDKPEANVQRVKTQLSELGLIPEDWGGDTVMCEVSALQGKGIEELLEMLALVSDLRELKCRPKASATGTVLEAHIDKGHGQVANVLIQNGTLRVGDAFIAGQAYGRVRAIISDSGQFIDEAGPSTPVEILGLNGLPDAGDRFQVVQDEKDARRVATLRLERDRQAKLRAGAGPVTLGTLAAQIESGGIQELPIVLKCDVSGSLEVLSDRLPKLGSEKVKIKLVHSALGPISESDVLLASATGAVILGFHVRPQTAAVNMAEREGVEIRTFDIIYELIEAVEDSLVGLLKPIRKEVVLGRAQVREIFKIKGVGTVAGCHVTSGSITRKGEVKLLRDDIVIYEGRLSSLKRFKDDASEVKQGFDCGMSIENFNDIKVGDVIESFREEWVRPEKLG